MNEENVKQNKESVNEEELYFVEEGVNEEGEEEEELQGIHLIKIIKHTI